MLGRIPRPLPETHPLDPAAAAQSAELVIAMVARGLFTPPVLKAMWGKPCPYCSRTMTIAGRMRASRDHLKPRMNGGHLSRGNFLIVCQACNGDKDCMSLEGFLQALQLKRDPRAAIVNALIRTLRDIGWLDPAEYKEPYWKVG